MLSSKVEANSSISPSSIGSSRKRSRLDELIDVLGVSVHSTKSSVHLTPHLGHSAEAEHLTVRSGSSSGTRTGASERLKSSNNSITRQLRLQPLRRPQPFNAMSEPLPASMTATVPLAIGGCRQCRRTFTVRLEFIHHMVDHFPALFYSFEPLSLKFDQCSSPSAFQNSSLDFHRNELIKSVPMSLSTAILPLAPLSPKTTASIGISRCQISDETAKSRSEEATSMPSKDDDLPYHMCPHCFSTYADTVTYEAHLSQHEQQQPQVVFCTSACHGRSQPHLSASSKPAHNSTPNKQKKLKMEVVDDYHHHHYNNNHRIEATELSVSTDNNPPVQQAHSAEDNGFCGDCAKVHKGVAAPGVSIRSCRPVVAHRLLGYECTECSDRAKSTVNQHVEIEDTTKHSKLKRSQGSSNGNSGGDEQKPRISSFRCNTYIASLLNKYSNNRRNHTVALKHKIRLPSTSKKRTRSGVDPSRSTGIPSATCTTKTLSDDHNNSSNYGNSNDNNNSDHNDNNDKNTSSSSDNPSEANPENNP